MSRIGILVTIMFLVLTFAVPASATTRLGFNNEIHRALSLEKRGDMEAAREHWTKVVESGEALLEARGKDSQYLLGTARAHYGLGQNAEAVEFWQRYIEVKEGMGANVANENPWVYAYLGLAYGKLGNVDKVMEYWSKAPMTLGPVYTIIQNELAALRGQ